LCTKSGKRIFSNSKLTLKNKNLNFKIRELKNYIVKKTTPQPNGVFLFLSKIIKNYYVLVAGFTALGIIFSSFLLKDGFLKDFKNVFGGPYDLNLVWAQEIINQEPEINLGYIDSFYLTTFSGLKTSVFNASQERVATSSNLVFYKVEEGDNLSSIANKFGISIETIVWANNLKTQTIKPNDQLIILPVSGLLYEAKPNDDLISIANNFEVEVSEIIKANNLQADSKIASGEKLIIPGAKLAKINFNSVALAKSNGENVTSNPLSLQFPTVGINWGKLHNSNAVDIANSCGTPVYAAHSGFISEALDKGWNSGYGSYIKISAQNGISTLYAHLSALFVSEGAYVNQGDIIGTIGNTGKVDGISGCHLHFEVHGASNPFAK
jgi:murein DD-endopeptidase MepM/ murein hydrolase activator NlpD